ncbi:MAG: hydroxyacylglutathione hydrolase [Neisseria sp.]|nr:hydroxyacylglutathione hydrolase [Neisseria sp.]
MLNITPIPAFSDNYIWLLETQERVICIDPGQAQPVLDYLRGKSLSLNEIWITHLHADHTGGIAELKHAFPDCRVLGASDIVARTETVNEGDTWQIGTMRVQVWQSAGHTDQHISFVLHETSQQSHVFCGDTLFSAGCGRVFTGTISQLFNSLQRFSHLPDNTLFYPAHEYTASNLRFAQAVEPENLQVQTALDTLSTPSLPVTLAHEKHINPFLRCHLASVQAAAIRAVEQDLKEEEAVFAALRAWKNRF